MSGSKLMLQIVLIFLIDSLLDFWPVFIRVFSLPEIWMKLG